MVTTIEWVAIVLLGIGMLKMIVGLISPKTLLDYKKNKILKAFVNNQKLAVWCIAIFGLVLAYFSYISDMSFAEWFVAGMTLYALMFGLLFSQKSMWDGWIKAISKFKANQFRWIAAGWLIFSIIGLYVILY